MSIEQNEVKASAPKKDGNLTAWSITNAIINLADDIRDQLHKKIKTHPSQLTELNQLLDKLLELYNQDRSQKLEQSDTPSPLRSIAKTIAFSLTAKRRQIDQSDKIDQESMALQTTIFNLRKHLNSMNPQDQTAQQQLLIHIGDLSQHSYLANIFNWRKNQRQQEEKLLDQFKTEPEQEIINAIALILKKITNDKFSYDLSDSFSPDNPQFADVSYVYDHVSQLSPEAGTTTKALKILAQALEYEEQQAKKYVSPFGKDFTSAYFWALTRHRLYA